MAKLARRNHPEPPEGLPLYLVAAWNNYWSSKIAAAATTVDLPALRRLYLMYQQFDQAMALLTPEMVAQTSSGRPNPLASYALSLGGAILHLENELGLTPMSRVRLTGKKVDDDDDAGRDVIARLSAPVRDTA